MGEWDRLRSQVGQNEAPRKGGGWKMITQDMETEQKLGNVNTERRGRGKEGQRNIKKNFFRLITTPPNIQI